MNWRLISLLMVFSVGAYAWKGAPEHLGSYIKLMRMEQRVASLLKQDGLRAQELQSTLESLQSIAAEDSYAWERLGLYYQQLNQHAKAQDAFAQAVQYSSEPRFLLSQVQHQATQDQGKLTPTSLQSIAEFLSHYPQHPGAVNLLAVDAYQRGDYHQAIQYWESLLHEAAVDSLRDPMMEAINKAKSAMIHSGQVEGPILKIQLLGELPRGAALFVSVKQAKDTTMPRWALKLTQSQPEIALSSLHAMNPAFKLNAGEAVIVTAKLTQGSATSEGVSIVSNQFVMVDQHTMRLDLNSMEWQ